MYNFYIIAHSHHLLSNSYFTTSNLLSQSQKIGKTSKSTTQQAPTSKSLCHSVKGLFRYVPTKQKIHIFHTPILKRKNTQTAYIKPFHTPYSFTLVINVTVSTWLDRMFLITTTAHFQPIGSVDTVHIFLPVR